MDVYQRAWASLLQRIEAKTSWGRNELKQQMLEALVVSQDQSPVFAGTAMDCQRCSQPLGVERGQQVHAACAVVGIPSHTDMESESAHSPSEAGELPW